MKKNQPLVGMVKKDFVIVTIKWENSHICKKIMNRTTLKSLNYFVNIFFDYCGTN